MKTGISLIEVVLGIAISAIMTIVLYRVFTQIRVSVSRADQIIDAYSVLALTYNQLDKDINGICLMSTSTQKTEKPTSFSTAADTIFTFVTTNALAPYNTQPVRPVRIVYRLQKTGPYFALVRQEAPWKTELKAFADTTKFPAYQIMPHIKTLIARVLLPKEPEQSSTRSATGPVIEPVTGSVAQWITYTKWTEEEQKVTKRSLPKIIEIEGTWVNQQQREHPFNFSFIIPFHEETKKENTQTMSPPQSPSLPAKSPPSLPVAT
jgi:hypothetical protein